jgi:two-component system sensor histidine kinase ResE
MQKDDGKNKNDYKVIISELGVNPFHMIKITFALMCIIPLLVAFYIVIGKHFLYNIFLGNNGAEMAIAILVAFTGLLYTYKLVRNLIEKLMKYAEERRIADSQKMELLAKVGSAVKDPLAGLKTMIAGLALSLGDTPGDSHSEVVKNCLKTVENMSKLTEDLPERGLVRAFSKRRFIDFRQIIKNEAKNLTGLAEQNKLDLKYTFVTDNANIWGDGDKLLKVMEGLIASAIKNTPRYGKVDIGLMSDADTIRLTIIYSGFGDETFDIAPVRDIIDLHNGHITVNSVPDRKTEFAVVLPRDLRSKVRGRGFDTEA